MELQVIRTPLEGQAYEATFWTRKEGYGDSADHWAIFLLDGQEIEIEYDYWGKRRYYAV